MQLQRLNVGMNESRARRSRSRERGFTLIEMVITLSMLVALAGAASVAAIAVANVSAGGSGGTMSDLAGAEWTRTRGELLQVAAGVERFVEDCQRAPMSLRELYDGGSAVSAASPLWRGPYIRGPYESTWLPNCLLSDREGVRYAYELWGPTNPADPNYGQLLNANGEVAVWMANQAHWVVVRWAGPDGTFAEHVDELAVWVPGVGTQEAAQSRTTRNRLLLVNAAAQAMLRVLPAVTMTDDLIANWTLSGSPQGVYELLLGKEGGPVAVIDDSGYPDDQSLDLKGGDFINHGNLDLDQPNPRRDFRAIGRGRGVVIVAPTSRLGTE